MTENAFIKLDIKAVKHFSIHHPLCIMLRVWWNHYRKYHTL